MSDIAIRVENLGKSYRIAHSRTQGRYKTLQEDVIGLLKRPFQRGVSTPTTEEFWALKDISFEVKQGEVLGIIGRNGAGKSTLLKILSRITRPTVGYAEMHGRIGSLLEVGTGFHPELTGRENIFLNGAVLGMSRRDIQKRFDEIVAFAEVEKFLDTPVKRYSSGMYMRLAFGVAAHLEPEILVVDEVLAVGDAEFQKKSLGKMSEVAQSGRTVLFVSHNMGAVEALCSRALLLNSGSVIYAGSPQETVANYLRDYQEDVISLDDRKDRIGSGEVRVTKIAYRDADDRLIDTIYSGQDVTICLYFCAQPNYLNPRLRVSILVRTVSGTPVFLQHNRLSRHIFGALPEHGVFRCRIPRLPLSASGYYLTYSVMIAEESYLDYLEMASELIVTEGNFYGTGEIPPGSFGPVLVDAEWEMCEVAHE